MEKFSDKREIIESLHSSIEINVYPYIRDHQFEGRVVIPAVELCQLLAHNIKNIIPDINNYYIYNASFDKFIDIKEEQKISVFNDIDIFSDGTILVKLLTKIKAGKSVITRTIEHVRLELKKNILPLNELTYDIAFALDGICFQISADKIYADLVPFGPAFHNLTGTLYVSDSGAVAHISAPGYEASGPLGSPFVFDAALHAASVWGQRYFNTVAFPIGFGRRVILNPTIPGQKYFARVIPKQSETNIFIFDIWIYDIDGNLCEAGLDVILKDVTNGKMKPPDWVLKANDNLLKNISEKCAAISVIELNTISDLAEKALSDTELTRLAPMKDKRRKSYMGARLTCKYLSRKLAKKNWDIPANQITTIKDKIYPSCPMPDGSMPYNCSVSHDSRFAAAVASGKRIGIDVEEISDTVLKAGRIYMSESEKKLVNSSPLDQKEASLRIWSIKEAVTKALDIDLSTSWKNVQINHIGKNISTFLINNLEINAYHSTVDNHLFTIVKFEK